MSREGRPKRSLHGLPLRALLGALALASTVAGAARAQAAPAPTAPVVPGCSTAVAPAPQLAAEPDFIDGPLSPFGVAITANSKTAFVADSAGAIYLYSLGSSKPATEKVDAFRVRPSSSGVPPLPGVSPTGLALTPNDRYLVAAWQGGAEVFEVGHLEGSRSGLSSWVTGTLRSSGEGAIEVAVSPDGGYVFVSLEDSNELAVFNLTKALRDGFRSSDLVGTVPLGTAPVGIATAPDGRYLYVTSEATAQNQDEGTLTTINLRRAELAPSHAIVSTVEAGCSPVRVAATSTFVYVTARGSDALLRFNASDLVRRPARALNGVVTVGEAPVGLALVHHDRTLVLSDSDRFAVAGQGASLAVVTTPSHGQMVLRGYIRADSFPRDMAASRNGKWLVVSNFGSSQVEAVKIQGLP
jgi:DNA-binding beta-propeller fold protein YncE